MNTDETRGMGDSLNPALRSALDRVRPGKSPATPGGGTPSVAFDELLEKLQRLRTEGKEPDAGASGAPSTDPVGELSKAVQQADDAHQTAMDIKRRLEEAFRRQTGS